MASLAEDESCLKWAFGLDVTDEVLVARAEAEHEVSLAADPHPGAPPDMVEEEYERLSDAKRDEFEESRREHRRL
eukprot:1575437-Prymnesium_polylepis.1